MQRRAVLGSLVALAAGCTAAGGGGDGGVDTTADPMTYLPDAGEGWTRTDAFEIRGATGVGAEAGAEGQYRRAGADYAVEVLRWSSASDARERGREVYASGWPVFVTRDVFSFACVGTDVSQCRALLARSPVLSPGDIAE